MAKPWKRRTGVIKRAGVLGARPGSAFFMSPNVIDSGEDAPLSRRGRNIFRGLVLLIVVAGLALIVLSRG